jgi:hypothetical protein
MHSRKECICDRVRCVLVLVGEVCGPSMRLAVLWLLLLQFQAGRVGLGQHLEARLDTVRRILHEVPLVDG